MPLACCNRRISTRISTRNFASKFDYGLYIPPFLIQLGIVVIFIKQLKVYQKTHKHQITADESFKILRRSAFAILVCGSWFTFYWGILFYIFEIFNVKHQSILFIGHTDILAILLFAIAILLFYVWRLYQSFRGSTLSISKQTLRTYQILVAITSLAWVIGWIVGNNFRLSIGSYMYMLGLGIAAIVVLSISILFVNKLIKLVVMQRHNLNFIVQTTVTTRLGRSASVLSIGNQDSHNIFQAALPKQLSHSPDNNHHSGSNHLHTGKPGLAPIQTSVNSTSATNSKHNSREPSQASRNMSHTSNNAGNQSTGSVAGAGSGSSGSVVPHTNSGSTSTHSTHSVNSNSRKSTSPPGIPPAPSMERKSTIFDPRTRQQPLIKIATKQTILLGFDFFAAVVVGLFLYFFPDHTLGWIATELMVNIVSITVWLSFVFSEKQYMSFCCCCHICCYDLCSVLAVKAVLKRLIIDEEMIARSHQAQQGHALHTQAQHRVPIPTQSPTMNGNIGGKGKTRVHSSSGSHMSQMSHQDKHASYKKKIANKNTKLNDLGSSSIEAIPETINEIDDNDDNDDNEDLPPELAEDRKSIEMAFEDDQEFQL